jgi:hypothetical protein
LVVRGCRARFVLVRCGTQHGSFTAHSQRKMDNPDAAQVTALCNDAGTVPEPCLEPVCIDWVQSSQMGAKVPPKTKPNSAPSGCEGSLERREGGGLPGRPTRLGLFLFLSAALLWALTHTERGHQGRPRQGGVGLIARKCCW